MSPRRLLIAGAVLGATLVASSQASAAILASRPCNRWALQYHVAGLRWVPVVGYPFLALEPLTLRWSDGGLAGDAQSDALGRLATGVFMPSSFISSRGPHVRPYALGAVDQRNGVLIGAGVVRFVRVDGGFQPRRRPHQVTRYALWGAPAGRKVWMHFYFRGRQRRTVYMGRANRPCGVVRRRLQVLPARSRYGTWTVYLTNSRKALSRRAIRGRHYLYRLSFYVYRVYVPRSASLGTARPPEAAVLRAGPSAIGSAALR